MSTSPIVKKPVPNSGLVLRTDNVSLRGAYDRRGSDGVSISPVSPVSPASREPSSPVHRPESFASIRSSIVSGATNSPVHRRPSTASVGSIVSSVMSDTKSSSGPNAKEKGKGKEKLPSVFHLLPREIIQQQLLTYAVHRILYFSDPNTFDSLTLLDRNWHQASQSPLLYAHQLRRCGVAVHEEPTEDSLPSLKRQFNIESRRVLFESILRPQVTEIQLICSSPSSAGALPGGDAFKFEFSPKGKYLLALSSSRIFVIYLAGAEVVVKREMKIVKRPIAAAILDDGMVLAVLSSNHVVTVYDLDDQKAKIIKTVLLEDAPRTIALSPGAAVLAAAYEGGIEVYSLHPSALSTDRRAVNCDAVDSLAFSSDGLVLLGTTLHTKAPTTVIISAPFFSADMPVEENLSRMWTTQVLFPRSSRDNSHASLLPEACNDDDENSWTFTYDRTFETFRAVRVDDLRNGHTYFTGPNDGSAISPTTLPAPSPNGGLVAVGFAGRRIWVYGIPGKLDLEPRDGDRDSTSSQPNTPNGGSDRGSLNGLAGGGTNGPSVGVPQWQVLCDKFRIRPGRQVGQVDGLAGLKFVKSECGERLVAVASGGVGMFEGSDGEDLVVDGGRVVVFDFSRSPSVAEKVVISLEIGEGQQGLVETLTEEQQDLEAEVLLARRRTVAQRTRQQNTHVPPMPSLPNLRPPQNNEYVAAQVQTTPTRRPGPTAASRVASSDLAPPSLGHSRRLSTFSPGDENISTFEEAVDLPYSHTDPRSRSTLNRAATAAAAAAHQSFGAPRHAPAGGRVVGPDGRPIRPPPPREEDNWVAPPPPYTPRSDNDPPLPLHLLLTLQPRANTVPSDMGMVDQLPAQPVRAGTFERTRTILGRAETTMRRGLTHGPSTNMNIGSIPNPPLVHPHNNNSGYLLQPQDGRPSSPYGESVSAPTSPATGMGEGGPGFAGTTTNYTDMAFNMRRPSTGQIPTSAVAGMVRGQHVSTLSLSSMVSLRSLQDFGLGRMQQQRSPQIIQQPMPDQYHQYQHQTQLPQGQSPSSYSNPPPQGYFAPPIPSAHVPPPQTPPQHPQQHLPPPTIVQQQLPPPINLIPISINMLQTQQAQQQQSPATPISPASSFQSQTGGQHLVPPQNPHMIVEAQAQVHYQQQQQQQGQVQGQHGQNGQLQQQQYQAYQLPRAPQSQPHPQSPLNPTPLQQPQSQPQPQPTPQATTAIAAARSTASRILSRSPSRGRRSVFHYRHNNSSTASTSIPPVPLIPLSDPHLSQSHQYTSPTNLPPPPPIPPSSIQRARSTRSSDPNTLQSATGNPSSGFFNATVGLGRSISRRPSRAERSAARNVRDARRRRVERELGSMGVDGGVGGGGKVGKEGKEKGCVVM